MHYRPCRIRRLLGSSLICLGVSCAFAAFTTPAVALDKTAEQGARPADLEGRVWRISQLYIDKRVLWPHPQAMWVPKPYIAYTDGKIEGSPGCGQFTGTYSISGDRLAISAKWADASGTPCNDGEKDDAARILQALANVRLIKPAYDALLLENENGEIQVRLAPMQPGKDLSELHDTFWYLKQLEGSTVNFSQIVINIGVDESGITFSTPSYLIGIPFHYHLLTGLRFSPAYTKGGNSKSINYSQDQQTAEVFEGILRKIGSYELKKDELTFFDKDRQPIMVLSLLRQTGIEDRKWRIAKYRVDSSGQTDKGGLIDAMYVAWVLFLNGREEGSPGAGVWTGTYKLSGDELAFDSRFIFEGAWSEEQIEQGYLVSKAFNGDLRIEQKGDQIVLRDKNDQAQILLVPY